MFYFYSSKQRDLYDETFSELVESVLNGYNGMLQCLILSSISFRNWLMQK